jgi:hypothetical protein
MKSSRGPPDLQYYSLLPAPTPTPRWGHLLAWWERSGFEVQSRVPSARLPPPPASVSSETSSLGSMLGPEWSPPGVHVGPRFPPGEVLRCAGGSGPPRRSSALSTQHQGRVLSTFGKMRDFAQVVHTRAPRAAAPAGPRTYGRHGGKADSGVLREPLGPARSLPGTANRSVRNRLAHNGSAPAHEGGAAGPPSYRKSLPAAHASST